MFQKLGDNFSCQEGGRPGSRQPASRSTLQNRLAVFWEFRSFKTPGAPGVSAPGSGLIFNCWQFWGVSGVSLKEELQHPVNQEDCQHDFGRYQQ